MVVENGNSNSDVSTNIEKLETKCLQLKDEGNKELLNHRYVKAIKYYSEALELIPNNPIILSNRALAYIKTESYGLAIVDATEAIKANSSYAKAYYRRGTADYALGKFKAAKKDFRKVCKLAPKDRDARIRLSECEKAVREAAFAAAIESDDIMPLSKTYDPSTILIGKAYDGPRLDVALDDDESEKALFETGNLPISFVMAAIEHFKNQKLIHKRYIGRLLLTCKNYFESLSSLIHIPIPDIGPDEQTNPRITVCGDTHGQFYDVLNIFEMNGYPSANNPYLFNGDFVDRGSFSVEVILSFLLLKISCPSGIHLLRGNHETKSMNKIYGFEGEVKHKYDDKIFDLFLEVFCYLPLAAVIDGKVFVTHGGLHSENPTISLDDIKNIKRGIEPPETGLMTDLLWSDPQPFDGRSLSKRGVGYSFGPDITASFLAKNNLELLIRSHEVKDEGYVVEHRGKTITIFSAPNYCDSIGNKGAFIHLDSTIQPKFTQFEAVPHPDIRPMAYAAGMGGLFA